ncbi:MAG: ester cyclase [Bacteroidia bacterium]|nr:ester cyclase [Bacteroidia bacterium]
MTTETLTNNKKSTTSETLESNKKIVRQTFEVFEKNDMKILDTLYDQGNVKLHFPGTTGLMSYDDYKKMNTDYIKAFPDSKVNVDLQIAEGEYVCTYVTFSGTHKGEFQGFPASNKKVKLTTTTIDRIVNGKIVEEWTEFDQMSLLQQIGAVPEMNTAKR